MQTTRRWPSRLFNSGWFALELLTYRGRLDEPTRAWIAENVDAVTGWTAAATAPDPIDGSLGRRTRRWLAALALARTDLLRDRLA